KAVAAREESRDARRARGRVDDDGAALASQVGQGGYHVKERLLAQGLHDHVGGEDEARAGDGPDPPGPRRRILELRAEALDAPRPVRLAEYADWLGVPFEPDAVGLRELVLVLERGYQGLRAAIGDRDGLGAQSPGGGRHVDGRVAGPDHHDVAAHDAFGERPR